MWKDVPKEYKERMIAHYTTLYKQFTNSAPGMPTEAARKDLAELGKAYGAALRLLKEAV